MTKRLLIAGSLTLGLAAIISCNQNSSSQYSKNSKSSSEGSSSVSSSMSGKGGSLSLTMPDVTNAATIQIAIVNSTACQATGTTSSSSMTIPQILAQTTVNTCVIKNVTVPYAAGQVASVSGLSDGSYQVVVALEDASNNILDDGISSATISGGNIAPVTVTLAPPADAANGGLAVSVVIAGSSYLGFVGTPLYAIQSTCTPLTLQLNANSVAVAAPVAETLTLTSSSTTGSFFADSACATSALTQTIPAGAASILLYYSDTAIGTPLLTALDVTDSTVAAASSTISVLATGSTIPVATTTAVPTPSAITNNQIVFTAVAMAGSVNTCIQVPIEVQSTPGAAVALAAANVISMQASTATGAFYSDAACSVALPSSQVLIAAGTADAVVYFMDSAAENPALAAIDGTDPTVLTGSAIVTVASEPQTTVAVATPVPVTVTLTTTAAPICWGAGGPNRAGYVLADQASAISCAYHIATKNKSCAIAARYGQVDCTQAARMPVFQPARCVCDGNHGGSVFWPATPTGF